MWSSPILSFGFIKSGAESKNLLNANGKFYKPSGMRFLSSVEPLHEA